MDRSKEGMVPAAGADMAERVRRHDWAATPLGPMDAWPEGLGSMVRLVLASRLPMIVFWGVDLTVAAYNDAYRRILGDMPEALGRGYLDVWANQRDVVAAEIEKVRRGESVVRDAPVDPHRQDGRPGQTRFGYQFSPLVDGDGGVAGVLETVTAMTGRERAEASRGVGQSAERLRRVLEIEAMGVVFYDFSGGVVDANDAYLSMIGYSRGELERGEIRLEKLTPPDWRWRDEQTMAELEASGKAGLFDKECIRKDGSRIRIMCAGKTLDDGIAVEIVIDVTERRRAEAGNRRAHALLQGIAAGTRDLIAALDTDFRLIYANASYLREYRSLWAHDLRLGENLLAPMAHWPDEQEKARSVWSRALSGETFNIVMGFGSSKLDERIYDLRFSPLHDEQGQQIGAAHIFRDITDQKLAEAALRESEERQAFLLRVSDALRGEPDADAIAERALRMLSDELQLDRCYVGVYRLADDQAVFPWQVGNDLVAPIPEGVRLSDFPNAMRVAFERTLVIEDVAGAEGLSEADRQSFHGLGLRALVAATLRKGENNPHWAIVAASSQPRRWTSGEIALIEEVTERTWVALERARTEAALRGSETRFRALVSSTSDSVFRMSPDWREMRQLGGRGFIVETQVPRLDWMEDFIPADEQPRVAAAINNAIDRVAPFELEHRVRQVDGRIGWVQSRAVPLFDEQDRLVEWFGAASDVTDRKRAEEHQNMLMAELDHRVKNILAVVQSIARQSLGRGAEAGPEAADRLIGRISALAQSHRILASSRWEGAGLRELIEGAVAPYRGQQAERISVEGRDLKVSPKAAQTLALAFHELVTNAAKYGALSRDAGRVSIRWRVSGKGGGRCVVFDWQEIGGPPIDSPPERKGFGSTLIERTLAFELDGDVELRFPRDGLHAVFRLPLDKLAAVHAEHGLGPLPESPPPPADRTALKGKRVLVVEDEFLVAEETAARLRSAGCSVVGPAGTLADALRAAVEEPLDAAVLDINLNGDLVWPAARALYARNIPFLFATGYTGMIELPPDLPRIPWIEKPLDPDRLSELIGGLTRTGTAE